VPLWIDCDSSTLPRGVGAFFGPAELLLKLARNPLLFGLTFSSLGAAGALRFWLAIVSVGNSVVERESRLLGLNLAGCSKFGADNDRSEEFNACMLCGS
jgi:hypothetical protein